jgi:hypothetical protein
MTTRSRTQNPLLYDKRHLRWTATSLLRDESFRLDVATDARTGAVRGIRIVPTTLVVEDSDGVEYQPEFTLNALKSLTLSQLEVAAQQGDFDQDNLPPELRARINALLASNTLQRRPSKFDSRALEWHRAVNDIVDWAYANGLTPTGVVSRAFSLHLSSADRWIREAEEFRSSSSSSM